MGVLIHPRTHSLQVVVHDLSHYLSGLCEQFCLGRKHRLCLIQGYFLMKGILQQLCLVDFAPGEQVLQYFQIHLTLLFTLSLSSYVPHYNPWTVPPADGPASWLPHTAESVPTPALIAPV